MVFVLVYAVSVEIEDLIVLGEESLLKRESLFFRTVNHYSCHWDFPNLPLFARKNAE
jgi:hypothetical protein